ncbi:MAG: ferredoxin:protochlorophyllide reductase (ATP-dependent) subunit B [Candidatus Velthaea sp.]
MKLALWAYQAPAHVGVCKAAASFSNIHAVLRAPKGDGYGTIMLAMFERLGVMPPISVCAMSEATLAGASANIPAVLREVDARLHPEMIVVTRSATAAVLQEPLDGEILMMNPLDVNAEIFQAGAHPVRDNEVSAFALTLKEITAHYAADVERTARPSVNIFGPSLLGFHDHSNIASLRRMLAALDIEVNAVGPLGASPGDLRSIGSAWVNLSTAHELTAPVITYLKERFGTPTVEALPYGEAGTTQFLRELCALLEIPAERISQAARDAKLLWYARTVDAHALSGKRVGVFGTPTTAAGIARVLHDELDMRIEFVGTYVLSYGEWLRARVADLTDNVILTDDFRKVAKAIDETRPDIMFGSQMERHSASAVGVPCAVISPPAHILNFPLGYAPFIGYDGANHIGDVVNQTQVLGLEHHLIETFGPRGQGRFAEAMPEGQETPAAPAVATAIAELRWDPAAERLVQRIPFFVRKKARTNIEKYAREHNLSVVDERTVLAAREHVGG